MSNWQETDKGLYRKFEFKDFKAAFGFMGQVAELAEQVGHHPDWENSYNMVEIWLLSHEGGSRITDQDYDLAGKIDQLTI